MEADSSLSEHHARKRTCLEPDSQHDSQSEIFDASRDQYYSNCFPYKDGYLFCEGMCLTDIKQWLEEHYGRPSTPFFVYSRSRLESNVRAYLEPMQKLRRKCVLNYALKANLNPNMARRMRQLGCSATLVSGLELRMALDAGFEPETLVLNGNGKQVWELEDAVRAGCLLNVDSQFNLNQTDAVCRRLGKPGRVLLRVNPDIHLEANVHRYNCTATSDSKFGVPSGSLQGILGALRGNQRIQLVGLHCHLGSTITDIDVFRQATAVMSDLFQQIKAGGFPDMTYLNLGGGLGIPYTKHAMRTSQPSKSTAQTSVPAAPSPGDVVAAVDAAIADPAVTLILEPGRSLIGDTAVLVCSALGVKHGQNKSYVVVDGSMTEAIRPALYGAYHHIDLAQPSLVPGGERRIYDVVGPVCESGDFLAKDRYLATPHEGCCVAMFDVGAYCASMASNYNCRARPAEVLVDGDKCTLIRKADTYESIMMPYNTA